MDNEKLIYEVSKHEELFDTKNKCYFDIENRQKLWLEISKIMNASPEHCKNRWRNLRTSFVNELRKSAKNPCNPSGRKYMYYQQMLFLLPYVLHRKNNFEENITDDITEIESNTYEYEYDNSQISIEHSQHSLSEDKKEFIDLSFTDYKNYTIVDQQNTTDHTDKQKNKRRRSSIFDYHREEKSYDPLKHFFMTMYETVKNFPPQFQISAKRSIFTVVTNLEEKTQKMQNSSIKKCN